MPFIFSLPSAHLLYSHIITQILASHFKIGWCPLYEVCRTLIPGPLYLLIIWQALTGPCAMLPFSYTLTLQCPSPTWVLGLHLRLSITFSLFRDIPLSRISSFLLPPPLLYPLCSLTFSLVKHLSLSSYLPLKSPPKGHLSNFLFPNPWTESVNMVVHSISEAQIRLCPHLPLKLL